MKDLSVKVYNATIIEMDETVASAVKACAETGRKITAIKLLRGAAGSHIDLLEAKCLVEFLAGQPYSDNMLVERLSPGYERFLVRPK